ncbi:hypothetical protein P5V15_009979 [Pogonomyrmex californicus]
MPVLPMNSKHFESRDNHPIKPEKNDIVLSYHDYLLRTSDTILLKRNDWLNDIIIGFYFEYLNQQYKKNGKSRLLFIGPEVAQLLKMQNFSQYDIFLDPIEARSYDFIFFPLNDCDSNEAGGSHWSLLVYSSMEMMCYHFDSSSNINSFSAKKLARKLIKYFLNKQEKRYIEMDCPQQNNSYDCGLYVLCLAEVISRHVIRDPKICNCDCSIITEIVPKKRAELLKLIYDLKNTDDSA